jgi:hypothetical protein
MALKAVFNCPLADRQQEIIQLVSKKSDLRSQGSEFVFMGELFLKASLLTSKNASKPIMFLK